MTIISHQEILSMIFQSEVAKGSRILKSKNENKKSHGYQKKCWGYKMIRVRVTDRKIPSGFYQNSIEMIQKFTLKSKKKKDQEIKLK